MDCSAFTIRLVGMLDDVYLHGKLNATYNIESQFKKPLTFQVLTVQLVK